MKDFWNKLRIWPTEGLTILNLFLEKGDETLSYNDVASRLKFGKEIDGRTGKSIGGILSMLRRNKLGGEPLIVPIGRALGTRRLQWKLNTKTFNKSRQEKTKTLIKTVLDERKNG